MGTSNFARGNAKKIYSFATNTEDQDQFDMEYEDTRLNVFHHLEKLAKDNGFNFNEDNDRDNNRSYSGRNICEIWKIKYCGEMDICVRIIPKSVSAYYDGCSLDWYVDYCLGDNCDEIPDEDDIAERLIYYGDIQNRGLAKIHARHLLKWIEKTRDELIKMVEDTFAQFSDPLICLGTFSNGESIYQSVNKE